MAIRNFGARHFNSISGANIRAVFGHKPIGELQAISYAIQREKAPVYVMGEANPMAFSRGKRGIAGTCVFIMFESHALLEYFGIYSADGPNFLSSNSEYRPAPTDGVTPVDVDSVASAPVVDTAGNIDFSAGYSLQKAWYVDQIPPFDITITGASEFGATVSMRIIGVDIMNEGYGISVDDQVSEQQYTYLARAVSPWKKVDRWTLDYSGAASTVVEARGV